MSSTFASAALIAQSRLLGGEMPGSSALQDQQRLPPQSSQIIRNHGDILGHSKMHMQINYEGRVRVLPGQVFGELANTLDDSGDTLEQSPTNLRAKICSDEQKEGSDSDSGRNGLYNGTLDSLERLKHICSSAIESGGHYKSSFGAGQNGPSLDSSIDGDEFPSHFHCHLCSFNCTNREDFNDHVNNHYEFRCIKCDFMTKVEADYRSHLKEEHSLTPEDLEDEQGVRVPRVNSQGKVKALKCKQCEYVTITKEEFWHHCKGHIKPEKLLTCPKCMFVTEYKHHLEYHLRNHFGSKPFKCPQCSYSCVNKSMLNSHMKSHTTVYQYRCKDCNYATKYCHSLKLHLRKYAHKPAMVLNPDGTPNPLPIVDVYGTRRGPKIKRDEQGNIIGPPQAVAFQKLTQKAKAAVVTSTQGNENYPLLPPYMMAQMKMQQLQQNLASLGTNRDHSSFLGISQSLDNMEDELEDEDLEDDENHPDDDDNDGFKDDTHHNKCSICDFETTDRNIYRNHMMLHASRDREDHSGSACKPKVESPCPSTVTSHSRHLSGMSFSRHVTSNETFKDNHSLDSEELQPSSSLKPRFLSEDYHMTDETSSTADYLEYLKQMAPLIKRTAEISQAPSSLLSSSVSSSGLSASPPLSTLSTHAFMQGAGSRNDLLSRLYLGSVVKNFQQREAAPISDIDCNASSGGALDLSQSFEPKRAIQANTPTSDQSGPSSMKSRRKGRAYKIERKSDSCSIHSGGSSEPEDSKSEESGKGGPPSVEGTNGSSYSESEPDKHSKASPSPTLKLSGNHICQPCQIAFMDSSMYLFHQECHDRINPLKCIKCGQLLDDAKDFFTHLIKESHK